MTGLRGASCPSHTRLGQNTFQSLKELQSRARSLPPPRWAVFLCTASFLALGPLRRLPCRGDGGRNLDTSVHFGSALRAFPLPALSPLLPPALGSFKPKGLLFGNPTGESHFPSLWCSTGSSTGAGPWGEVDRGRGGGIDTSAV